MSEQLDSALSELGFSYERGGAHTSRTLMLDEMKSLLSYLDPQTAEKQDYQRAIVEENCLAKRSGKTRVLTHRHLVDLYGLDLELLVFRALAYFWNRDPEGRPLLALLCAYCRDSVFRPTADFILGVPRENVVTRDDMEGVIDAQEPGRFSSATLKSTAQNINSSWTKSGHLDGRVRKVRIQANATAGSVSYALLLGYLSGARGPALFRSEFIKLLDCTPERAAELAQEAASKGWLIYKRLGDVIEVAFPSIIKSQDGA